VSATPLHSRDARASADSGVSQLNAVRWHFADTGAGDGATQMASDAGLLAHAAATGHAVFRVYAWSRPTLSFGRHESTRGRFRAASLAAAGVDAVRRPTGGRVLLHDHEVTYAVTMPVADDQTLRQTFGAINGILLAALRSLGVAAEEVQVAPALRPGGAACFAAPGAGEIVVDGCKLVGSAQVRAGGALLQHGSILLEDDQARIATLAESPLTPSLPAATLRSAIGARATYRAVCDALRTALDASLPAPAAPLDAAAIAEIAAPHLERFRDPDWTWRR
jgi:lipoate-protein ligase A